MNESMTIDTTSDNGKWAGCVVPAAATWFLKYICERSTPRKHFENAFHQTVKVRVKLAQRERSSEKQVGLEMEEKWEKEESGLPGYRGMVGRATVRHQQLYRPHVHMTRQDRKSIQRQFLRDGVRMK